MTISRMQEPRQLYGLGSLVKKITKPIKKIVKSPIGKAALGAAAIYGLGGGFGAGGFKAGNIPGIGRFFTRGRDLSTIASGKVPTGFFSKLLGGAKKGIGGLSFGQKAFLGAGAGLSLLPFLTGGAEEEEEIIEEGFDVTPSTIANIRQMARDRDPSLAFLPQEQFVRPGFFSPFAAAEGGIAELPQVRMLEGGVPEIDYRQSGGFVPMGKKEKADDVPAMLSKNEFVMTADAVRGMGDGNVEKGAQRMYDQMRQLENRTV
jgi:hypothetical protein